MARDLGSGALADVRRHREGVGTPARSRRQLIFEIRRGGLMEGREVVGVTDSEMHNATRLHHSLVASAPACFASMGRTRHVASPLQGPTRQTALKMEPDKEHIYSSTVVCNWQTPILGARLSPRMSSMKREHADNLDADNLDADTRSPIQCINSGPMTQLKAPPSFFEYIFKRHLHRSSQLTSKSVAIPSLYTYSKLSTSCM